MPRSAATLEPQRGQTTIVCAADNSGFEPPLKKVDETPDACYTSSVANNAPLAKKGKLQHEKDDSIDVTRTRRNFA